MADRAQMKVFVSHSHTNNAFCAELVQGLKAAGADVWYDDERLHTGQLGPVIERELRDRPVFLVVLSPAALQSRWVEDETRWAYGLLRRDPSRIILPVLAEALPDEGDIWLFLQDFKRVEAADLRPFSPTEAVARTLHALQLTLPGEAPLPTAPQPSESAGDLVTRGRALIAQNNYAEALPLFQRATQLDARNFSAWFNVGYTLHRLNRPPQERLDAYEHATALNPNSAVAWYNKGAALLGLKRYAEALAACDRALALDTNLAFAWSNKGAALLGLKRYAEALAACDRALALDTNLAFAWSRKGETLFYLKRYDEALAAYDRALALDTNLAFAWVGKGVALSGLKRYQEAVAAYDRALAIDTKYALALSNKGISLRALGRTAEAEEAERRAKALGG